MRRSRFHGVRWRHRFLAAPALDKPIRLKGIVEADETFILESFKGRRAGLPRPARKRGGKAKHSGRFFENIPVLVARDRHGATIDGVLPEDTAACVAAALQEAVTPDNRLVCDGGGAIRAFARRRRIPLHVVAAPGKPDPAAPDMHINNVNAYHGRLKRNGCVASAAWRPRTCPTTSAGDAPSKPGAPTSIQKIGCSAPSERDHINS